jgi:hypothetical protein
MHTETKLWLSSAVLLHRIFLPEYFQARCIEAFCSGSGLDTCWLRWCTYCNSSGMTGLLLFHCAKFYLIGLCQNKHFWQRRINIFSKQLYISLWPDQQLLWWFTSDELPVERRSSINVWIIRLKIINRSDFVSENWVNFIHVLF